MSPSRARPAAGIVRDQQQVRAIVAGSMSKQQLVVVSGTSHQVLLRLATVCFPYVRTTQRGKWYGQAKEYGEWQVTWKERIRSAMATKGVIPLPGAVPLWCSVTFCCVGKYHRSDLDNQVKSMLDLCQGVVFAGGDSWIDRIVADRLPCEENRIDISFGRI